MILCINASTDASMHGWPGKDKNVSRAIPRSDDAASDGGGKPTPLLPLLLPPPPLLPTLPTALEGDGGKNAAEADAMAAEADGDGGATADGDKEKTVGAAGDVRLRRRPSFSFAFCGCGGVPFAEDGPFVKTCCGVLGLRRGGCGRRPLTIAATAGDDDGACEDEDDCLLASRGDGGCGDEAL